ncbi:MAG: hypothetical protein A2770_03020 [Candidatus Levybacteria bacterium RIFCSPHIGHO2_01_FULL_38_12]|nr:MAG: hypothetical protein A2770_03020 [Candidatus Levybacteria bacterium RIFCSPHIGHO2_01_FULL_38_12]
MREKVSLLHALHVEEQADSLTSAIPVEALATARVIQTKVAERVADQDIEPCPVVHAMARAKPNSG